MLLFLVLAGNSTLFRFLRSYMLLTLVAHSYVLLHECNVAGDTYLHALNTSDRYSVASSIEDCEI